MLAKQIKPFKWLHILYRFNVNISKEAWPMISARFNTSSLRLQQLITSIVPTIFPLSCVLKSRTLCSLGPGLFIHRIVTLYKPARLKGTGGEGNSKTPFFESCSQHLLQESGYCIFR